MRCGLTHVLALIAAILVFAAGPAFAQTMGTLPHALGSPSPALASVPQVAVATGHAAKGDNPVARRATDALNLLESHGYAEFTNFTSEGTGFTATVIEGTKRYDVVIKPDTNEVFGR